MRPFRTAPIFKDKIWAGGRLAQHVPGAGPQAGEAWLVSDVEGDASPILDSEHAGATLRDLVAERAQELLGPELAAVERRFPLLVKVLDIQTPLSVQLHPDGPTARALGHGDRGKCEAWLVLANGPEGRVWLGVPPDTSPDRLLAAAEAGGLADLLSTYAPELGEGFPILPGTLHTAQDLVVLEVQETSDITYRVFDWGRGRELHLAAARTVLERLGPQPAPPRRGAPGWTVGARDVAAGCPFQFEALELGAEERWEAPAGRGPMVVVPVGPGSIELETAGNQSLAVGVGEAAVVPALAKTVVVRGPSGARIGWAARLSG